MGSESDGAGPPASLGSASGFASGGWDCGREEELRDEEELLLYLAVVVLTVALRCTALGIRNALDRLSAASIVRRNVTR